MALYLLSVNYVMADMDIYNFFKSQGSIIESDPADFDGINGCHYYQGRDNENDKAYNREGHRLIVAPHEGVVPFDVWLAVNKKLMGNKKYQTGRKASNTWLAGKLKCTRCGYALKVSYVDTYRYLRCSLRAEITTHCEGTGLVKARQTCIF